MGSGALTRANRRSLVESDLRNDLHADEINERAIQGLESSMMLKGDNFQFDFGHTNSDGVIVSLVGGAEWMLETSPNSRLTFGAERRAVTDSLLSYSGLIDSTTGESGEQSPVTPFQRNMLGMTANMVHMQKWPLINILVHKCLITNPLI